MAVAIPALVGATMASGVAVGLGMVAAGSIGAAIAGGIGSMLATSLANGTNPFDDPAGAIASVAMGAMFSQATQGWQAADGITIDGVEAASAAQGVSAASTLTNNLYDTALSSAMADGMDFMTNIGYDNYQGFFDDVVTESASNFGSTIFNDQMADQAFIRSINESLTVNADPTNYFNLDIQSGVPDLPSQLEVGGIFTGTNAPTDNYLAQTFFSPSSDGAGNVTFGTNQEMLDTYNQSRTFGRYDQKDPFDLGNDNSGKPKKMPSLAGAGSPATGGYKLPQMPQAIQTLMGSQTAGAGTGGQGGYKDTQNKVVGPMIESYRRQQERMSTIANQTWGIQQTSRFSGLLS